jgi:hypothetical protein
MHPLPQPAGNGTRPVSPARRPATPPSGPPDPAAGELSRLDRITLQLGVAVAVVIAVCSYAVSATSLYALGSRPATAGGKPPRSRWSPTDQRSTGCSGSSAAPAAAPKGPAMAGC